MDREAESVLTQQILAFHQVAAMASGIPELEISEFEAKLLAGSIGDLTAHYGPVLSGPAMLWTSFSGIAAMIYVPRASQVAARLRAMRRNRAEQKRTEADVDNVIRGEFTRTDTDPFKPGNIG